MQKLTQEQKNIVKRHALKLFFMLHTDSLDSLLDEDWEETHQVRFTALYDATKMAMEQLEHFPSKEKVLTAAGITAFPALTDEMAQRVIAVDSIDDITLEEFWYISEFGDDLFGPFGMFPQGFTEITVEQFNGIKALIDK